MSNDKLNQTMPLPPLMRPEVFDFIQQTHNDMCRLTGLVPDKLVRRKLSTCAIDMTPRDPKRLPL